MHKIKLAPVVVFAALVVGALPARADDASLCAGIDDNQAIGACTRLLTKKNLTGTDRATYLIDRGVSYEHKGDHDRAIADYSKAIELKPDDAHAFFNRGLSYRHKGDDDRAIADYTKAIELKPDYAFAFYNRGFAYGHKGDDDRAIADYSKAIELTPDDADALINRGTLYEHKGDDDRAIADYNKSIELKPDDPVAFFNRGLSYRHKGDDDRAIADYSKAIELKPDYAFAFYNRGFAYGHKGDDDRAIADYSKAIELKPDDADAFINRGFAYGHKGDDDRAIADYSKAIELKPDDADAFNNRGISYEHKGDDDRAIADYSKAIELKPDNQDALNNLEAARKALADKANASTAPPVVSASQTQPANTQQAALAPAMASPKPAPAPASAAPLRRVALVIGNSAYRSVPGLPNPQHDADLVASSLRTAGIDVTVVHDADRSALLSALNSFADKADGADWAIIYYAGHGIEMDGHNYLVPVDATITSDRTITDETISLDRMMSAANGARQLKLVVIDACRNNPFKPKMTVAHRSIDRGLSRVEPEDGTLVVYAAKEGTLAKDGEGDDSPFALSFAKRILEPGVEINMAMRFVRQDVLEATGREQEPFVYGSLPPVNYYFVTGK